MKFLIFNIIVFCSLGYLLTSKPNENFNEWLVNTKEKISQISKEEVISKVKRATSKNKEENLVKTFKNENIKDLNKHDTSKLTDNKILKNNEEQKVNVSSKFMTHLQRESALADLIIDMELHHLNSFKN